MSLYCSCGIYLPAVGCVCVFGRSARCLAVGLRYGFFILILLLNIVVVLVLFFSNRSIWLFIYKNIIKLIFI